MSIRAGSTQLTGEEKNSIKCFAAASVETAGSSRNEEVVIFFKILFMVDLNLERDVGAMISVLKASGIFLRFETRKRLGGKEKKQEKG